MRVLLVEGDPADAVLLTELLKELPVPPSEVRTAERLDEAIGLLGSEKFDLVLLDLSLPDASGPTTVRRAQVAAPDLPVVVLTGVDDDHAAILAVQEGAQDYLVKGRLDGPLLDRSLRYAIQRKGAEASARREARESAARAEAEASAARWRLLSEASRALASSFDVSRSVAEVAELVVPVLSDFCAVDLLEPGRGLRRLACAHADPGMDGIVAALGRLPAQTDQGGTTWLPDRIWRVEGSLEMFFSKESVSREHRELYQQMRVRSVLVVPLRARGRVLGRMLLLTCSESSLGAEDVAMAEELGVRIALAIEGAQLYRAREEILGVVSHDLRNPLSVVALCAALLRNESLPAERRRQQLVKLDRSVTEMRRLIDDLLDVSRLDGNGISVRLERLDPRTLIEEAGERLSPLAEERDIHFSLESDEGLAPIEADRERCLQVFSNVVGNAIKFTPPGGSVRVLARAQPGGVRFEVTDTGMGIAPEDLHRVFDRFFQSSAGSARQKGAGLGLSIARGVIEAHSGQMNLTSEFGKGTTVSFTLPAVPAVGKVG